MADRRDELDELRAEVARLRADVERAEQAARDAEADAGRARGAYVERYVQLERARQDQARFQESTVGKLWTAWHHTGDRLRVSWRRRLRRS